MHLIINGESKNIEDIITVQDLLLKLGYDTNSVAVARNNSFLSRSKYVESKLKDGEEIEILLPMQGG